MKKLMKNNILLYVLISFVIIGIFCSMIPLFFLKDAQTALTGTGTADDPIVISTTTEFKTFANNVNGGNSYSGQYIVLSKDIDFNYTTFTRVGIDSAHYFQGNFDGQGHSLKNIYIKQTATATNANRFGVFSYVSGGAIIKNLNVENISVYATGADGANGATGASNAVGTNGANGILVYAAGLVGYSSNATIQNCNVSGIVSLTGGNGGNGGNGGTATAGVGRAGGVGGSGTGGYAGGIVGYGAATNVEDCSFTGTIYVSVGNGGNGGNGSYAISGVGGAGGNGGSSGYAYVGGISGRLNSGNHLSGSYVDATITIKGGSGGNGGFGGTGTTTGGAGGAGGANSAYEIGGLIGMCYPTYIENCYAGGKIEVWAGCSGIAGSGGQGSTYGATGATGAVTRTAAVGGIGGYVATAGQELSNVISAMDIEMYHNTHNTTTSTNANTFTDMIGGVLGYVNQDNISLINVVSLGKTFVGEKYNLTNTISPIANYSTTAYRTDSKDSSYNVKYLETCKIENAAKEGSTNVFYPYILESSEVMPVMTGDKYDFTDVFKGFSTDDWQIVEGVNNGLPVPVGVKINKIEKRVYNVSTRSDLLKVSKELGGKDVILEAEINILADMDLGDWTPIGLSHYEMVPKLVINGNGHTLSGMEVTKTSDYKGLVGYVLDFECYNLTIKDPRINGAGGDYAGALVGYVGWRAVIENCHVTTGTNLAGQSSTVTGREFLGGLAGYVNGFGRQSSIKNSSSTVNVKAVKTTNVVSGIYAGGLVGAIYGTTIENSFSAGEVTCETVSNPVSYGAGGLVGLVGSTSNVSNCFATGNVAGSSDIGFIGATTPFAHHSVFANNYYSGTIYSFYTLNLADISNQSRLGAIVGNASALNLTFSNNVSVVSMMTTAGSSYPQNKYIGKLYAMQKPYRVLTNAGTNVTDATTATNVQNTYSVVNNYYNSDMTMAAALGASASSFANADSKVTAASLSTMQTLEFWRDKAGFDFNSVWTWDANVNDGLPTLQNNVFSVPGKTSAIEINNINDLVAFRDAVNAGNSFAGKDIVLNVDINLYGINWTPIGLTTAVFQGNFDGQGHTISNMRVSVNYSYRGLFGYTKYASIKNLTLLNPVVAAASYTYAGGLVGYILSGQILDCHVIGGSVESLANYVGGLAGYVVGAGSKVENCSVGGDTERGIEATVVSGTVNYAAGLVAYAYSASATETVSITNCVSGATVSATSYTSGLVARAGGAHIDQCYFTGSVVGGGIGIGGIVGYSVTYATTISNCMVSGDVIGLSINATSAVNVAVGGIAGYLNVAGCSISNCLVTGNIKTFLINSTASLLSNASGILGYTSQATTTIGNCAVVSEQIMAANPSSTYAFASPMAGAFISGSTTTKASAAVGSKNFYNRDMLLTARKGGDDTCTTSVAATARSLDDLKLERTYSEELGWDFSDVWIMFDGINNGLPYLKSLGLPEHPLGSKENPYLISNASDFKTFSQNINAGNSYAGKYIALDADIDMTGIGVSGRTQAISFRGSFDGREHKFLNVNIAATVNMVGIFGYSFNSTFKNIIIENPKVTCTATGSVDMGALLGYGYGNIYMENCAVVGGSVTSAAGNYVGGLVGLMTAGIKSNFVTRCFSSADLSGGRYLGGLMGRADYAEISHCYSTGNVTGTLANGYGVGGFIGYAANTKIADCYSKCNVSDSSTTALSAAGGIVGYALANTEATNCYFNGNLTSITTAPNSGTNGAYAGGIFGYCVVATAKITNCLSVINSVTATAATAPYIQVGYFSAGSAANKAVATNCYYVETQMPAVKGTDYRVNTGTPVTLADITSGLVFGDIRLGWDLNDVWEQDSSVNGGFPILRNMIVDTAELTKLLESAKKQKADDWNDSTFANLTSAIEAAEKDMVGITQELKDQHVTALTEAMAALRPNVDKLKEVYDQTMEKIVPYKDFYSNFSVTESILSAAKAILDEDSNKYRNSDVNSICSALLAAIENLKIDKTELNKLIEEANGKNADDYLPEPWEELQTQLLNAVAVNNNSFANPDEILDAATKLQKALDGLKIDKSTIVDMIIQAYSCIGVQAQLLEDSSKIVILNEENRLVASKFENYSAFEKALEAAIAIQEKDDASVQEIHDAVFNLNVELNALTLDKKALQDLYNQAILVNQRYFTTETVNVLVQEILKADTILTTRSKASELVENSNALDAAVVSLQAALDGLAINKVELEELITLAEGEEEYKALYGDSWADLEAALAAAKSVDENADATTAEIQTAMKNLNAAIQNLEINIGYLKKLITEASDTLETKLYYTAETLKAVETARDEANDLEQKYTNGELSRDDIPTIKTKTLALQNALDNLEVDIAKLNDYVARVEDPLNDNYISPKLYAENDIIALQNLATATKAMLRDEYTEEKAIAAILDFEAKFKNLQPNKTELAELVKEVSTWTNAKYRQDNEGNWIFDENGKLKLFVIYEVESWDAFQKQLDSANDVLISSTVTLEDVAKAKTDLQTAIDNLVVDTSELQMRMEKAEGMLENESFYTKNSVALLNEKLLAAKTLLSSETALKIEDVQTCLDELVAAIDGMQVDRQGLLDLIEKAEGLKEHEAHYTVASYNNLCNQIDFVKGVAADEKLTADDISLLADILNKAIDALEIVTDDLVNLIAKVNALEEEFVTAETYLAVSTEAKAAQAMLDGGEYTFEEYIEKLQSLQALYDAIKPNMDNFGKFIADNEALLELEYSEDAKKSFQERIESAKLVLNNAESTYEDVINAVHDLREAKTLLLPDKNALDQLILMTQNKMNGVLADVNPNKYVYEYYTPESYQALIDALNAGAAVVANPNASLEDVEMATKAINDAIAALVVDKALLQSEISRCDLLTEEYYEAAGFGELKTQLAKSKVDIENDALTLDDYIASYQNLQQARENLIFKTDALDKLITDAKSKVETEYTDSSYTYLLEMIDNAEAYKAAISGGGEEETEIANYNDVCKALDDAIANLVKISDLLTEINNVQPFVTAGNDGTYSAGSFKAVSDLLEQAKELYENKSATQAKVDEMIEKLKNYQDLLIDLTDAKTLKETEQEFIDAVEVTYTAETWLAYTNAIKALDDAIANADVTKEELDKAMADVAEAKAALEIVEVTGFEVVESNTTFIFIDENGESIDLSEHEYDPENPMYLANLAIGDSLADIIAQFENDNIKAFSASGEEITDLDTLIGTGMVLSIINDGEIVDSITLVIRGDINGDGVISMTDKGALNAFTNETRELTGAAKLACDLNGDGSITMTDKGLLNAYTNETRDIYAGLSVKKTVNEEVA